MVSDGNGLEIAADLSLPILTKICAHLAKRLGVFGEVVGSITNPYHRSLLSLAAGVSPLPASTSGRHTGLNTLIMKHPFTKTLALATVMILGCTLLHYLIGSMSY